MKSAAETEAAFEALEAKEEKAELEEKAEEERAKEMRGDGGQAQLNAAEIVNHIVFETFAHIITKSGRPQAAGAQKLTGMEFVQNYSICTI